MAKADGSSTVSGHERFVFLAENVDDEFLDQPEDQHR
jgi:hypothetical protein